jgi:hypothetical protein
LSKEIYKAVKGDSPSVIIEGDMPLPDDWDRVTNLQPTTTPSSPVAGDMYMDSTDSNKLKVYDGSAWHNLW